jgi:hypothetical protein
MLRNVSSVPTREVKLTRLWREFEKPGHNKSPRAKFLVLQGQPDRTAKQLQSSGLGKVSTGIALSSSLDKGAYAHKCAYTLMSNALAPKAKLVPTLTALAVSNGGSNECEHAINKTHEVDDPHVANTSCLGRGNQCQSDGTPAKAHRSDGTESWGRK